MKLRLVAALICLSGILDEFSSRAHAAEPPVAVVTFHCVGLYWKPSEAAADNPCRVEYRPVGSPVWCPALPLWFDPNHHQAVPERAGEYRGSIVNLHPGTRYEVRLTLERENATSTLQVTTWNEDFKVKERRLLPRGHVTSPLVISDGGSNSEGYVLYESAADDPTVIDVANAADACVVIRASHVILRGVTLKGARRHGVVLQDVSDIVIDRCDISGWGRQRPGAVFGENFDSGIFSESPKLERVVVQRCRIHDPRFGANSWGHKGLPGILENGHPQGPQGITFMQTAGNHVLRYNEIYADETHGFNDGMGALKNFSFVGFPHRDSDIYGNRVSNVWDDALEIEGAGMNVRVWGNFLEHTFVSLGLASTSLGPLYVFRNVSGFARRSPPDAPAANGPYPSGGSLFKLGATPDLAAEFAHGKVFLLHNTILQPLIDGQKTGAIRGLYVTGKKLIVGQVTSRNNLLDVRGPGDEAISDPQSSPTTNDYDYDLVTGVVMAPDHPEKHRIEGSPRYEAFQPSWVAPALAIDSPGRDGAEVIPNFNDFFGGAGPDVGAAEADLPPLEFGVTADWNRNLSPNARSGLVFENDYLVVRRRELGNALEKKGFEARIIVALASIVVSRAEQATKLARGEVLVVPAGADCRVTEADFYDVLIKAGHPAGRAPLEPNPPQKNEPIFDAADFHVYAETLLPGDARPAHTHNTRLVIDMNSTRLRNPLGQSFQMVPDRVVFTAEAALHKSLTNIGERPLRNIVIEFKAVPDR